MDLIEAENTPNIATTAITASGPLFGTRISASFNPTLKAQLNFPATVSVYRAVGCRECRQTGYHGRRGIFEWMDTTNEIRQMILKNCSSGEIRDVARRGGMRGLAEDGWRLVRDGVTTPEEVLRVTKAQSLGDGTEDKPAEIVAAGQSNPT